MGTKREEEMIIELERPKMTGKQIMLSWLKKRTEPFDSLIIQMELPSYGKTLCGRYHTPDSYLRYFRMVKSSINLIEVEGKWKTWMVGKFKETLF